MARRRLAALLVSLLIASPALAQQGGQKWPTHYSGTGSSATRKGDPQYLVWSPDILTLTCGGATCAFTPSNPLTIAVDGNGSGAQAAFILASYGPTADLGPSVFVLRRARGTIGSPTPPQAADKIGTLAVQTYDNVNFDNGGQHAAASIEFYATQNHDSTHHGTSIKFFTTPDTASAPINTVLFLSQSGAAAVNALLVGAISEPLARFHIYEPGAGNPVYKMESETTNDNPTVVMYQGRQASTNATPGGLIILASTSNAAYQATALVVARCTGGSCSAGQALSCEVRSTIANVSGTAAVVGTNSYAHCNSNITGLASGGGGSAGVDTCQEACTIAAGASCGSASLFCVIYTGVSSENIVWHLERFEVAGPVGQ